MHPRTVILAATAAVLGLGSVTPQALAAWHGLRKFDCQTSRANWNFDGLYGPFTTRAVKGFQRSHHLMADGVAGPLTYKALGLPYTRTLRCGDGGKEVLALQEALYMASYWYGNAPTSRSKPKPRPTSKPRKAPTPKPTWTAPPVIYTPTPVRPTPMPTWMPTAAPSSEPTPEPTPAVEEAPPENRPTLELKGGDWMVPKNAGQLNYDTSFAKPVYTGEATLWLGDVGLSGGATLFNETWVDYRPTVYMANQTLLTDGVLKYRWDHGYYQVFGGYRGIGLADVNMGTVGMAMDRPLLGSWLWLQAKAQGAHDFKSSFMLDGQAGLGLRFNPLTVEVGFRHIAYQNGTTDPRFHLNGPVAQIRLAF